MSVLGSAAFASNAADQAAAAESVQELLDAVSSPEFQNTQCRRLLDQAEMEVARVLNNLDYDLVLTARGNGGLVGDAECHLSSSRTVNKTYEGVKD